MVGDQKTSDWIRDKGFRNLFMTFCNQNDLVPAIMQTVSQGVQSNIAGNATDGSNLASALLGMVSREMTRNYYPFGVYCFFESDEGHWDSMDSELIFSRLEQNAATKRNAKYHPMDQYRDRCRFLL